MRTEVENKGEPEPRKRPVLGFLGRASLTLTSLLPRQVSYFLGGVLGWLVSFLPLRERRATRVNLALCFPELPPRERGRLARQSFMEVGRYMLALGGLWKWERARFERLFESVRGEDAMEAAIARGKGIIVVVPHLGGWELAGFPSLVVRRGTPAWRDGQPVGPEAGGELLLFAPPRPRAAEGAG